MQRDFGGGTASAYITAGPMKMYAERLLAILMLLRTMRTWNLYFERRVIDVVRGVVEAGSWKLAQQEREKEHP